MNGDLTLSPCASQDSRKKFQKASDEYDSSLSKYVSKKPKDTNWTEASFDVAETKKSFHHSSLEYTMKLNEIQAKKRLEFLERVLLCFCLSSPPSAPTQPPAFADSCFYVLPAELFSLRIRSPEGLGTFHEESEPAVARGQVPSSNPAEQGGVSEGRHHPGCLLCPLSPSSVLTPPPPCSCREVPLCITPPNLLPPRRQRSPRSLSRRDISSKRVPRS